MSKLTTDQVLADLGRTNINNIKHIKNNINNINTINDFTSSGNHQVDVSSPLASSPSAPLPASQPVGVALATSGTLPWRYFKADLFDNASPEQLAKNKRKFNLKLSFLLHNDSNYQYLSAAMNTPWRNIKRGFNFSLEEEKTHYDLLETLYHAMSKGNFEHVRASKCYVPAEKGKGQTIVGASVLLARNIETEQYHVLFVEYDNIYELTLTPQGLTDNQRAKGCIASGFQGETARPKMTARQFFRR